MGGREPPRCWLARSSRRVAKTLRALRRATPPGLPAALRERTAQRFGAGPTHTDDAKGPRRAKRVAANTAATFGYFCSDARSLSST